MGNPIGGGRQRIEAFIRLRRLDKATIDSVPEFKKKLWSWFLITRQWPQPIDQRQNNLGQNYLILFLMRMTRCNTKGLKAKSQND